MNDNTLISVHGYAGDAHQVAHNMALYKHHQCPVVIMSPVDSQIKFEDSSLHYRFGGKRAYTGYDSLERQWTHMRMLLEFPHSWFLMHDSDSICLSPELPKYLYQDSNIVWANIVSDAMHPRGPDYPLPRLAFQPPYFMSRGALIRLVELVDRVRANGRWIADQRTPFIDHFMMHVTVLSRLPYRTFPDGMSTDTRSSHYMQIVMDGVQRRGLIFLHSVKHKEIVDKLVSARRQFTLTHPVR